MTSLWEKCSLYGVSIEIMDTDLSFPREQDSWITLWFVELDYSIADLICLNRVRIYQQVLFLLCILNAKGSDLDEKYLYRPPRGQQWSELKFPKEKPSPSDFNFWRQAVRQLVPVGWLAVRLGCCLHKGYKIWDWRVNVCESYLLH